MKKILSVRALAAALLVFSLFSLGSCSSECLHIGMTETVIAPTCDVQGKTVHLCESCGYTYDSSFVAPLGHTMSVAVTVPTCATPGNTYNACDVCGYNFFSDHLPSLGHTLSITETAHTCNTEGFKTAACELCDYTYVYDTVAPSGHNFKITEDRVTTCKQTGSVTYVCDCGFSYVGDYEFYSDIFTGAYTDNTEILAKGIDVSYHNHSYAADGSPVPLDWAAIKAAGYDFAILRAGYIGQRDVVFEMNYKDARAAGLDVGVYFYSYADSVEEARAEALFLLDIIKGKKFEYPVYFDIEDERLMAHGKQVLTDVCVEFISILQENGYYGALYTNNNWLTTLLQTDKVTTLFDVWYARYPSLSEGFNEAQWNEEKYGKQMTMWQFSKTGQIEGLNFTNGKPISFDLNYAYKDYPTLIKEHGYNGY